MTKPVAVQGKSINGLGLRDAIAAKMKEHQAEMERVAAMSPEDRAIWEAGEMKRQEKVESILKQLRGPGFMEMRARKV